MIKIYGLKFYTRTTHEKIGGKYFPKMLGVIEGPIDKMMKAYQEEFSFMSFIYALFLSLCLIFLALALAFILSLLAS